MSVFDMKCPECLQVDAFHIAATVWGEFSSNGFNSEADDLPSYDNIWGQYAGCVCPECGKEGVVEDFLT